MTGKGAFEHPTDPAEKAARVHLGANAGARPQVHLPTFHTWQLMCLFVCEHVSAYPPMHPPTHPPTRIDISFISSSRLAMASAVSLAASRLPTSLRSRSAAASFSTIWAAE